MRERERTCLLFVNVSTRCIDICEYVGTGPGLSARKDVWVFVDLSADT